MQRRRVGSTRLDDDDENEVDVDVHGSRDRARARKRGAARVVSVGVVALAALGLGACSSSRDTSTAKFDSVASAIGGDSPSKASQPASNGQTEAARGGVASGSSGAGSSGASAPAADGASFVTDALDAPPGQTGRSFISSASMTVRTDDVAAAKVQAVTLTETAGGGLFGEQTTFAEKANAVLTLKVPPAKFRPLLDDLARLGSLQSQEVKTDDVTSQVIDLDARIQAAEASLGRTQALLGQATNLNDIANLEREVSRRQADLESLRGQRKTLADRVDLATVVLTLTGDTPTPAIAEAKQAPPPAEPPTFSDGLARGTDVASTVGSWLLALIGALLPFAPVVLVIVGLVALGRRRRDRGVPTPSPTPTG